MVILYSALGSFIGVYLPIVVVAIILNIKKKRVLKKLGKEFNERT